MKNGDYIKISRKMLEWEHYGDAYTKALFLHLLLIAAFREHVWNGITVKKGQCISSSRELSSALGISTKYVTQSIVKLRESGEISTERCFCGTLFTINNYAAYQDFREKQQQGEIRTGSTDF